MKGIPENPVFPNSKNLDSFLCSSSSYDAHSDSSSLIMASAKTSLEDWAKSKLFLLARLGHIVLSRERMSPREIVLIIQVKVNFDFPDNENEEYKLERFYLSDLKNIKGCTGRSILDSLKYDLFRIGPSYESVKVFLHDGYECCSIAVQRSLIGTQSEKKLCEQQLLQEIMQVCELIFNITCSD